MKGSHLKYGVWTPLNPKTVRVEVGSNGFDNYSHFWSRLTGMPTGAGLFFVDGCVERWLISDSGD